jgi:hypothetical protein
MSDVAARGDVLSLMGGLLLVLVAGCSCRTTRRPVLDGGRWSPGLLIAVGWRPGAQVRRTR